MKDPPVGRPAALLINQTLISAVLEVVVAVVSVVVKNFISILPFSF
jgi:hypothetical protein